MGRQRTSFSLWGAWNERLHMFNNADAALHSSVRPISFLHSARSQMHLVKGDLRHLLRLRSGWIF